ncbi:MAG: type II secretion system protein N [Thiothrix sp.]
MKIRTLILAGTVSFLLASLPQLPASLLLKALPADLPLQVQGIGGTLWQGYIDRLTWQTLSLNSIDWKLHSAALRQGKLAAHLSVQLAAGGTLQGDCAWALSGTLQCANLSLSKLPAAALAPYTQQLLIPPLSGHFQGDNLSLTWRQGTLPQLNGQLEWQEAGVQMLPQRYGTYRATLSSNPDSSIHITLSSAKAAAFTVDGTVSVRADGQYQSQIHLKPEASVDAGTKQFLASFIAAPQPDGTFQIREQGQLPLAR